MYNPKVTVVLPIYKEFYLSSIQLCEKKNYSNEIKVKGSVDLHSEPMKRYVITKN